MLTQDCLSKTNHGQTFEQSSLFKSSQITFQDTCKFDGEPRVFYEGPHFKISSFHPDRIRVLSPPQKTCLSICYCCTVSIAELTRCLVLQSFALRITQAQ